MAVSTVMTRVRPRAARRAKRRPVPAGPVPAERVAPESPRLPPLELETIASHWQLALDAAQRAVGSAVVSLPVTELGPRRRALARERQEAASLLLGLAREARVHELPWLSPVPVRPEMLGLADTIRACLFDLDGVLTDSGRLHARAWGEVFDEVLLRLSEKTGWHFIPFDQDADYHDYLEGRPRLEGIHAFLDSRGIRLPEGRLDDSVHADTAYGLARHKGEVLARALRQRGPTTLAGARRYLVAAGHAGIARGVVSASASTATMLELAGLAELVEYHVDADVIARAGLRTPPAPDVLLLACRHLGVPVEKTVAFTQSEAEVAAGRAAGIAVVGVGDGGRGGLLRDFGAERVVPSLSVLLDPRLGAAD